MSLAAYNSKRDFSKTSEPVNGGATDPEHLIFVIQKHAASHLHYDFRLEMDGVLKSWAIPKGPSTDPAQKRLAMMVEDHPYAYHSFEGNIPKGEYGGGSVIVWDEGYYEPLDEIQGKAAQQEHLLQQLEMGSLKIRLHGQKLNGEFALVKTKGMGENGWLMIKHHDEFASSGDVTTLDRSVVSGKDLTEVAADLPAHLSVDTPSAEPQGEKSPGTVQKMPQSISPMLATLIDEPFDSEQWQFEVKWDGYRAISYLSKGNVEILSRNNKSFDSKFSPLYQQLQNWSVNAILDGEIVVLGDNGLSDFSALQNWHGSQDGKLVYYLFDILSLNGEDLTSFPLSRRRELLESLELPTGDNLRLGTIYSGSGIEAFRHAEQTGLEGIVAKRRNSLYLPGKRSKDWLKIKVHQRQEVVIAGFTKKEDSPRPFSSLLLGVYQQNGLRYVGKVGTGFSQKLEKEMIWELLPLQRSTSPFSHAEGSELSARLRADISKERTTWLEPELVCEVAYSELTKDGFFRHPAFKGMRIDKKPASVVLEKPLTSISVVLGDGQVLSSEKKEKSAAAVVTNKTFLSTADDAEVISINGHEIMVNHLDKLYWPKEHITKRDMLNYYHQVAEFVLPYLKDRPLSLNRFPGGINGPSFYQKDVSGKAPEWISTFPYATAEGLQREYAVGEHEDTLLWMASMGCIEMNPWFSRTAHPDRPDYAVIDLDPDEHNSFSDVVTVALEVRHILSELDIDGFCKTSGSTGIHIYLPLGAKYSFAQSQSLVKAIVDIVNHRLPALTSMERSVVSRGGKMYLDFLQNKPAATVACPYSLRPKPGAPVSTPLHWEELRPGLSMYDFHIGNTLERLRREGDLFSGVLGGGIDLPAALIKAQHLLKSEL
jgi:bifunctional non-homologous end joining protein LigD